MSDRGMRAPQSAVILGIPFDDVSFADAVEWVRQRVLARRPAYIATANMDFIMQAWQDPELQRILFEADLVVADGIPIVWLSRFLGPGLKGRVTGSDLVPLLAELAAREGFSLFGLGGAPGVAEQATGKLVERYPGLRIAGCYSPPKADILTMNNAEILARLDAAAPDMPLVAFGATKQDEWVNLHIRQWRVPVAMGVGGSLDFLAGAQTRAPRFVQRLALEWLWRMLSDPRRLVGRYVANLAFLLRVVFRLLFLRFVPVASGRRSGDVGPALALPDSLHARCMLFPPAASAQQVEAFRAACAVEARNGTLVIDLGLRPWLNSRDLGVLIDLSRISRAAGRRLHVLASHPRAARLLRFVRLDRYMEVAETAADVVQDVRQRRDAAITGCMAVDPECRLSVVLPVEFTAANLAAFRSRFEHAWQEMESRGAPRGVTVDASTVEFIDSAALGFLVAVRNKAGQLHADFRCLGFRAAPLRTLKLARLESLMTDAVT